MLDPVAWRGGPVGAVTDGRHGAGGLCGHGALGSHHRATCLKRNGHAVGELHAADVVCPESRVRIWIFVILFSFFFLVLHEPLCHSAASRGCYAASRPTFMVRCGAASAFTPAGMGPPSWGLVMLFDVAAREPSWPVAVHGGEGVMAPPSADLTEALPRVRVLREPLPSFSACF